MIFISIDDNELGGCISICDEVFGEENFIGNIIWNSTKSVTNTALISNSHTYNLCYSRNKDFFIKTGNFLDYLKVEKASQILIMTQEDHGKLIHSK